MRFVYVNGADLSHGALAVAFAFEPYYGGNLDALHDCLTEISAHTMIVLEHSAAADGRTLRVILDAVCENRRLCIVML